MRMAFHSRPMGLLVAALAALLATAAAQTSLSQTGPATGGLCACTIPSSQACQEAIKARCDKPDPALATACTQMTEFALNGAAQPVQSLVKYLQENCKLQPPTESSACRCVGGADTPECVNAGWFACMRGNELCPGMMLGQKASPEAINRLANYIGSMCKDLGLNNVDMNFTDISAEDFNKNVAPGVLQSLSSITGVPRFMITSTLTSTLTSMNVGGTPAGAAAAARSGEDVPATGLPGGGTLAAGAGAAAAGAGATPGALAAAAPGASEADKGVAATQSMGFGHRKLLQGGGLQQAAQRSVTKQVQRQVLKYTIRSQQGRQDSVNASLSAAAANNGAGFQKAFSQYGVKANPAISVNGASAVGGSAVGGSAVGGSAVNGSLAGAARAAGDGSRAGAAGAAGAAAAAGGAGADGGAGGAGADGGAGGAGADGGAGAAGGAAQASMASNAAANAPAVAEAAAADTAPPLSPGGLAGLIIGCFFGALLIGLIPLLLCMGCCRKSIEGSPAGAKVAAGKAVPHDTSSATGHTTVAAGAAGAGVAAAGVAGAGAAAKKGHGDVGSGADKDVHVVRDSNYQSTTLTQQAGTAGHTSRGVASGTTANDSAYGKSHNIFTGAGAVEPTTTGAQAGASSARYTAREEVYTTAADNLTAGDASTAGLHGAAAPRTAAAGMGAAGVAAAGMGAAGAAAAGMRTTGTAAAGMGVAGTAAVGKGAAGAAAAGVGAVGATAAGMGAVGMAAAGKDAAGTAAAGKGAAGIGARAIGEGTTSSHEGVAAMEDDPELGVSDSRPSLFSRVMGLN